MSNIVEIHYIKDGAASGRGYHYLTSIPLAVGDRVICPTKNGESSGIVTEVDVPDGKIDERVVPLLKTIDRKDEEA